MEYIYYNIVNPSCQAKAERKIDRQNDQNSNTIGFKGNFIISLQYNIYRTEREGKEIVALHKKQKMWDKKQNMGGIFLGFVVSCSYHYGYLCAQAENL
jgi:hypothetical protein